MKTTHVRAADREDRWLLFDASEHVLGRMAVEIARALMGKDRPTYTPSEPGAHVVVVNSAQARLTGKKNDVKEYVHYTHYHDGRKVVNIDRMRVQRPNDIVTLAVKRMLPKNRLGKLMLKRLKVYPGAEHPHTAQNPQKVSAAAPANAS